MINASLHVSGETGITWHKSDSGETIWVKLVEDGAKLVIFTETVEDAQALVSVLRRIRQHLDPAAMNARYGSITGAGVPS